MMALLLDHGLRVGELAGLQVTGFALAAGMMAFYRPKVDKAQTHKLSADTLRAVTAWIRSGDAPGRGPLLRGSRKGGELTAAGMSARAITARVRVLGEALGIAGLSAHDCRHYWATHWAGKEDDCYETLPRRNEAVTYTLEDLIGLGSIHDLGLKFNPGLIKVYDDAEWILAEDGDSWRTLVLDHCRKGLI